MKTSQLFDAQQKQQIRPVLRILLIGESSCKSDWAPPPPSSPVGYASISGTTCGKTGGGHIHPSPPRGDSTAVPSGLRTGAMMTFPLMRFKLRFYDGRERQETAANIPPRRPRRNRIDRDQNVNLRRPSAKQPKLPAATKIFVDPQRTTALEPHRRERGVNCKMCVLQILVIHCTVLIF